MNGSPAGDTLQAPTNVGGHNILPVVLGTRADVRMYFPYRLAPPKPGEKPRKIPVSHETGRPDSPNDARTRAVLTYREAADAARRHGAAGVGLFATLDPVLVPVDLDRVFDETGDIDPRAVALLDIAKTYVELSPSRLGLRMLVLDPENRLKPLADGNDLGGQDGGLALGLYGRPKCKKWVTLTGLSFHEEPRPVCHDPELIEALLQLRDELISQPAPGRPKRKAGDTRTFAGADDARAAILSGASLHPARSSLVMALLNSSMTLAEIDAHVLDLMGRSKVKGTPRWKTRMGGHKAFMRWAALKHGFRGQDIPDPERKRAKARQLARERPWRAGDPQQVNGRDPAPPAPQDVVQDAPFDLTEAEELAVQTIVSRTGCEGSDALAFVRCMAGRGVKEHDAFERTPVIRDLVGDIDPVILTAIGGEIPEEWAVGGAEDLAEVRRLIVEDGQPEINGRRWLWLQPGDEGMPPDSIIPDPKTREMRLDEVRWLVEPLRSFALSDWWRWQLLTGRNDAGIAEEVCGLANTAVQELYAERMALVEELKAEREGADGPDWEMLEQMPGNGLCRQLADYALSAMPAPFPELAAMVGLGGVSMATSNGFVVHGWRNLYTPLQMYLVGLAESGEVKSFIEGALAQVAGVSGVRVVNMPGSEAGFREELQASGVLQKQGVIAPPDTPEEMIAEELLSTRSSTLSGEALMKIFGVGADGKVKGDLTEQTMAMLVRLHGTVEKAQKALKGAEAARRKAREAANEDRVVWPALTIKVNEIGKKLEELGTGRGHAGHGDAVMRLLFDITNFGAAWGAKEGQLLSSRISNKLRPRVDNPAVGLVGFATGGSYYGGLTQQMMEQGHANRFLAFHAEYPVEEGEEDLPDGLPPDIHAALQSLRELVYPNRRTKDGRLAAGLVRPPDKPWHRPQRVIELPPELFPLFRQARRELKAAFAEAELPVVTVRRFYEHAARIAGLLALGRHLPWCFEPDELAVTVNREEAEYAIWLVKRLLLRTGREWLQRSSVEGSTFEVLAMRLMQAIEQALADPDNALPTRIEEVRRKPVTQLLTAGMVHQRFIDKVLRAPKSTRADVVEWLVAGGYLTPADEGSVRRALGRETGASLAADRGQKSGKKGDGPLPKAFFVSERLKK